MEGVYSKVKSIEEDGIEDVYCINVPDTSNFIANGIVVHNCDALRYAIATHHVSVYDPYKHKDINPGRMVNTFDHNRDIRQPPRSF